VQVQQGECMDAWNIGRKKKRNDVRFDLQQ
jgi:hypothetical protein